MEKTVIELFAGVGGFRVGLNNITSIDENGHAIENGNFKFVWANQWEPSTKTQHAFDCYNLRFPENFNSNTDISSVDKKQIPNHSLLCGGFPCQDYSVAHSLSKEKGIEGKKVDSLLELLKSNNINNLEKILSNSEIGKKGIAYIEEIISILKNSGIQNEFIKFDLSLARGLASYTGAVWEFEIMDGNVGSVSGGGRYDKAVSKYIGKEIPATGTSFGLERLTEIIKDRDMLLNNNKDEILIVPLDKNVIPYSITVANQLRESDINSNIYPNIDKLKNSFKYADRKNYTWIAIIGEDEQTKDVIQLKNIKTKEQFSLNVNETIKKISQK